LSDNIAITAGSGTTIAADEVTRNAIVEKQQIIKIAFGLDGAFDGLVSPTTPLPVGGSTASCLGKAEDAAHTTGDVGVMSLGIRRDTATALADTVGDYIPFAASQYGAILCNIDSGFQVAAATGILKLEDAAHASGDAGVFALAVRNDSLTSLTSTDLDYSAIAVDNAGRIKIDPGTTATSLGKLEDAAHTTGDLGVMALGVRADTAASATGTTGDYSFFATNSFGSLKIDVDRTFQRSAADCLLKAEDAAHASGDAGVMCLGVRNDANAAFSGTDLDYTPMAVTSAGQLKIGEVIPGTAATALGKAEDAAHTTGDTGVFTLGIRNDASAALTSTNLDYSGIAVDSAGRTKTVSEATADQNGTENYKNLDLDEVGYNVKGSAGQVYGWTITNKGASARFIKLYNVAGVPVVGTDTPFMTLTAPPNVPLERDIPAGIKFATGIGIAATTGVADSDTGAPTTNDVQVSLQYK